MKRKRSPLLFIVVATVAEERAVFVGEVIRIIRTVEKVIDPSVAFVESRVAQECMCCRLSGLSASNIQCHSPNKSGVVT